MKRFVVDASTTAAWCLPDEQVPQADLLMEELVQGGRALVPSVWTFEIANIIWAARRRKRITDSQSIECLHAMKALPIMVEHEPTVRVFDAVFDLAVRADLTVYDAAYLELAARESLPLASLDLALREAAVEVGVELA